jgi:hypothetical protein
LGVVAGLGAAGFGHGPLLSSSASHAGLGCCRAESKEV